MENDGGPRGAPVLIVRENGPLAGLLAAIVEEAGAKPIIAFNGQQALNLARSSMPQVVITDSLVERMCGEVFIAALREEGCANLPIILVSGRPRATMLKAGADAVLSLPFRLADLTVLLDRYIPESPAEGRRVMQTSRKASDESRADRPMR